MSEGLQRRPALTLRTIEKLHNQPTTLQSLKNSLGITTLGSRAGMYIDYNSMVNVENIWVMLWKNKKKGKGKEEIASKTI